MVDSSPYAATQMQQASLMGSGMDVKMQMLIDRIDNIGYRGQRIVTGHYFRAMSTVDMANPAPLGFMAFSLATCLYMTSQAGLTEASTQFLAFPLGMFFGGLTMEIVAVLEVFRRNSLGATAFGTFGAFWISVGVYGTIRAAGTYFLDSPHGQEAVTALFGVAAFGFMVVSIAINLALPIVFFMIGMMFFLLSAGTTRKDVGKAAGWWGIFTAAFAFYIGLAILFEDMWGREVLPLFYTKAYKKHAKLLFPRVSEHDPMSITSGVPYEGRPELHPGDNLQAMMATPSLISIPRMRNAGANGGPASASGAAGEPKRPAEYV
ncbi:hypothetical protein ABPG77_007031 [Micractinium sp. CCAP 211/92]